MLLRAVARRFTSTVAPTSTRAKSVVHLVDKAANLIETNGSASAFLDMRVPGSQWFKEDIYLFAYDFDANVIFNAAAPEKEGTNVGGHPDKEGKLFHDAFIEVAQSPSQHGWVDYKWPLPGGTEPKQKFTYTRSVNVNGKGAALMSGYYEDE